MRAFTATARGVEDGIMLTRRRSPFVRVGDSNKKGNICRDVKLAGDFGRDIIWYEERGHDFGSLREADVGRSSGGRPKLIPAKYSDGCALVKLAYYEPGYSTIYLVGYVGLEELIIGKRLRKTQLYGTNFWCVVPEILVIMEPDTEIRIRTQKPPKKNPSPERYVKDLRLNWDGETLTLTPSGAPMWLGEQFVPPPDLSAEGLAEAVVSGIIKQFDSKQPAKV